MKKFANDCLYISKMFGIKNMFLLQLFIHGILNLKNDIRN